ncbi:MAG: alpha/beta hydrolase [Hoeflea sp.]|nr:alpha/beta hydrolase [Alphaproteobacteria bacterium]MBV1722439.1 alpha/beta hydrolase [Hoeflea sp.]MBU4543173.1 alpha/beta hydrolase [Alphaproteobacteria bacterium]MBU4550287.1 alpha/beta hydrolase [Alphaproteobacteria bacterium]MBV1761589.1 alpha/beta hydrolase [Hoeflea sp.]
MSDFSPFTLSSPTGADLAVRHVPAEGPARGVVQINHGLAEHAARYARFATFLARRRFHVYAHDHRGHGLTRAPDSIPGAFASKEGATKVIADVAAVHALIAERHPGLPVVTFGHSMGGLIALNFAEAHPGASAALAVWNSNFNAGIAGRAGQAILAVEAFFKGSDTPSAMLPKLTFQAWAKAMPNRRTDFDWLSREANEVDLYIADPLCGWDATVSMWRDVFELIYAGGATENLAKLPKSLPVHLIGGAQDPATDKGEAVKWLEAKMRAAGLAHVTLQVLAETRHETLNEINREQSMANFAVWLDTALPSAARA